MYLVGYNLQISPFQTFGKRKLDFVSELCFLVGDATGLSIRQKQERLRF